MAFTRQWPFQAHYIRAFENAEIQMDIYIDAKSPVSISLPFISMENRYLFDFENKYALSPPWHLRLSSLCQKDVI